MSAEVFARGDAEPPDNYKLSIKKSRPTLLYVKCHN